jgi:hypothetical protein
VALAALDYPTDIRWERVCVTRDMLDPTGCGRGTPPRWSSSIAVFRYVPEDRYQVYAKRRIVYFKVTCTITGYQPKVDEVAGEVDWEGLSVAEVADFEDRLTAYMPCHGAVVQVSVVPPTKAPLDDYPYFLDFQPKQRSMYELASDTRERSSRSLESLAVQKSAGAAQSQEVIDIDQGFSIGGTGEGQVAGTGGGGGASLSRSGQWGTKTVGQQEAANLRTTESSRENRETLSHTAQISQMYNLFQAYHLGTNRAVFWVGPRPHVLEEPSALVRGPRPVDGIQELFLVVSEPQGQGDACISVRLDTAHLTVLPLMEVERRAADHQPEALVSVAAPAESSTTAQLVASDDPNFDCLEERRTASDQCEAPAGFSVEETEDLVNETSGTAATDVVVSADRRSVSVTATATGRACHRNATGDAANTAAIVAAGAAVGTVVNPIFGGTLIGAVAGGVVAATGADVIPEHKGRSSASAHRKVRVKLVSDQPIVQTGTYEALVITTRGLCCCEDLIDDGKIIDVDLRPDLSDFDFTPFDDVLPGGPGSVGPGLGWGAFAMARRPPAEGKRGRDAEGSGLMATRVANAKADAIGRSLRRAVARTPDPRAAPALDTPFLIQRLLTGALATPAGRRALRRRADETGAPAAARGLAAQALGRAPRGLSAFDLVVAAQAAAAGDAGDARRATRAGLAALGVPLRRRRRPTGG